VAISRTARPGKAQQNPIAAEGLSKVGCACGIVQHKNQYRDAMICGELRHDARHLVASHRNQCDIVLIVGVNPLDRVDSRGRSTVTNDVLKHQTITADIREPLAARDDRNAMATFLESGCIERPDDACAIYDYLHGCLRAFAPYTTNFKRIVLVAPLTLLFRTRPPRLRSLP
jgi:hypothetical protein